MVYILHKKPFIIFEPRAGCDNTLKLTIFFSGNLSSTKKNFHVLWNRSLHTRRVYWFCLRIPPVSNFYSCLQYFCPSKAYQKASALAQTLGPTTVNPLRWHPSGWLPEKNLMSENLADWWFPDFRFWTFAVPIKFRINFL